MAEAAQQPGLQSRLFGIDLLRMQIEDCRPTFVVVEARAAPACRTVWKDPTIATPADSQVHAREGRGRAWNFDQRTPRSREQIGLAFRDWNPVPIVANGEDTGIVGVAFLQKNIERPERARGDRIAGRPVTAHAVTG